MRVTQEAAAEAMEDASAILAKEAIAMAPWNDDTGDTRKGFEVTTVAVGDNVITYLHRADDHASPYLEAMERGEIGGWGNPPPVESWDEVPGEITEIRVMEEHGETFIELVRNRFYDTFNRKIGTFRGSV
jgi:hypothetical protein